MGHNLGMWHDCVKNGQYICSRDSKPRRENGRDCYGYMDYDPKTNQWSHCNVNDLRKADKSCLKTIVEDGSSDTEFCPATYRFAFRNGKYCCQTKKDNSGRTLTTNSRTCQFNAYRQCPGETCEDHKGKNLFLSVYYHNKLENTNF